MQDSEGFGAFDDQVNALEQSLGGAGAMAAAFDSELGRMQSTFAGTAREVSSMSASISRGLRGAFEGVVFDGMRLSDALRGVARSMSEAAYTAAVRPVFNHFGGILAGGIEGFVQGAMGFADGGAFAQGRVMPFAKGGVVTAPMTFPMRGATGLMGEAGPEAILPLARGADGALGVRAPGGGARPVSVVMNITTPDVQGFQRSQTQIAAEVGRALSRGQRNR